MRPPKKTPKGTTLYQDSRTGELRYKVTLPDGVRFDRLLPPPENGPITEAYSNAFLSEFVYLVEQGFDPRRVTQAKPAPELQTVGSYVMEWIDKQTYDTAKGDKGRLVMHFVSSALAAVSLEKVLPSDCLAFVQWLKSRPSQRGGALASRSVRTIANCVKRALDQARRDRLTTGNPWDLPHGAVPGVEDKDPSARDAWKFSADEAAQLYLSPEIPFYRRVLYAVLFFTGARPTEVSALRVGDYDPSKKPLGSLTITKAFSKTLRRLKSTKTRVARLVPVHEVLAGILAHWLAVGLPAQLKREPTPNDVLLPSMATGLEWSHDGIAGAGRRDMKRLKLTHRRIRSTRRTHISLLQDEGVTEDMILWWTHGRKRTVMADYTTMQWQTFCRELGKLPLPGKLPEPKKGEVVGGIVGKPPAQTPAARNNYVFRVRTKGLERLSYALEITQSVSECSPSPTDPTTTSTLETPGEHSQNTTTTIGLFTGEALAYSFLELAELNGEVAL